MCSVVGVLKAMLGIPESQVEHAQGEVRVAGEKYTVFVKCREAGKNIHMNFSSSA